MCAKARHGVHTRRCETSLLRPCAHGTRICVDVLIVHVQMASLLRKDYVGV
jgi:hypothetical protein